MTLDDDLLDLFNVPLPPPRPSTRAERCAAGDECENVQAVRFGLTVFSKAQKKFYRRRALRHALRYRADAARYARLADGLLLSCGSAEAEVDVLRAALRASRADCATLEYERASLASAVAAYARAMTHADAIEVRAAWEALCELAGVEDA